MGRGTKQVFTMWVPYGDISLELGGLMILEGSHKKSNLLGNYLRRDVDSYCLNRPGAEEAKAKERSIWDGCLTKNPVSIRQKLGGRWLTAELQVGDVVIFGMTLIHASLDNQTDRIRFSSDSRYQLASEAVDDRWVGPKLLVTPAQGSAAGSVEPEPPLSVLIAALLGGARHDLIQGKLYKVGGLLFCVHLPAVLPPLGPLYQIAPRLAISALHPGRRHSL